MTSAKIALFSARMHCWETEIDVQCISNLNDFSLIKGVTYREMVFDLVKEKFVNVAGLH